MLGGHDTGDDVADESRWTAEQSWGEGHGPRPAAHHDAA
jgi:hypothetical protein